MKYGVLADVSDTVAGQERADSPTMLACCSHGERGGNSEQSSCGKPQVARERQAVLTDNQKRVHVVDVDKGKGVRASSACQRCVRRFQGISLTERRCSEHRPGSVLYGVKQGFGERSDDGIPPVCDRPSCQRDRAGILEQRRYQHQRFLP